MAENPRALRVDKKWASTLPSQMGTVASNLQASALTSAYNTIVREKDPTVKPGGACGTAR